MRHPSCRTTLHDKCSQPKRSAPQEQPSIPSGGVTRDMHSLNYLPLRQLSVSSPGNACSRSWVLKAPSSERHNPTKNLPASSTRGSTTLLNPAGELPNLGWERRGTGLVPHGQDRGSTAPQLGIQDIRRKQPRLLARGYITTEPTSAFLSASKRDACRAMSPPLHLQERARRSISHDTAGAAGVRAYPHLRISLLRLHRVRRVSQPLELRHHAFASLLAPGILLSRSSRTKTRKTVNGRNEGCSIHQLERRHVPARLQRLREAPIDRAPACCELAIMSPLYANVLGSPSSPGVTTRGTCHLVRSDHPQKSCLGD